MSTVNVHEAKTHFSRLLGRVESGEEIIIAKAGRRIAKLVPVRSDAARRQPGSARGSFEVTDAFFEPLPDSVLADFER